MLERACQESSFAQKFALQGQSVNSFRYLAECAESKSVSHKRGDLPASAATWDAIETLNW